MAFFLVALDILIAIIVLLGLLVSLGDYWNDPSDGLW